MKKYLVLIMAILFVLGCKKKDDDPRAPVIVYNSISAASVEQFDNSLEITISYEDFQGDLGEVDPDNYSVRIKDTRLSDYDWYHVPPVTPDNKELHVKGTFTIVLDPLFLLGSGIQETTRFSIEIRDREGNWSNAVNTPNVLIVDSL